MLGKIINPFKISAKSQMTSARKTAAGICAKTKITRNTLLKLLPNKKAANLLP